MSEVIIKKDYDIYGELVRETPWLDDKRHGTVKSYTEGRIWITAEFVNGLKHGSQKSINKFGQIYYSAIYSDGFLHGEMISGNQCHTTPPMRSYYLYGYEVTKDKFKEHGLIEQLSGIEGK